MEFFKSQIRLNFDTFNIAQPSTNRPEDNSPNGRTQCQVCVKVRKTDLKKICLRAEVHDCAWFSHLRRPFLQKAQFSANSAGPSAPVICGTNTGYHMILEVGSFQNLEQLQHESSFNVITDNILGAGWLQHIIFHMDFSFPSKLEHSNYAGGHFHLHIHSDFVFSILSCDFIWSCTSLVLICKHVYIFLTDYCVFWMLICQYIFFFLCNLDFRFHARLPGGQRLVAFSGSQVLFKPRAIFSTPFSKLFSWNFPWRYIEASNQTIICAL